MIIALNNKSNLNKQEFKTYYKELNTIKTKSTIILCPTFMNINLTYGNKIILGSQNVSKDENGAFTGEISASQLHDSGVKYTIVGHSERREYQKETLEDIHEKMNRLFENDITPILCIGESLEERKSNQVREKLDIEILSAIKGLTSEQKKKIIVAYEPIWSIGTGKIPTIEEIEETFGFIKKVLPNNKILYGGSANEKNIDELKKSKLIDGYLLGGLSLKPKELKIFINKLEK